MIIVEHIAGYHSQQWVYDERAARLTQAGFTRFRNEADAEGKFYEVWLLHGAWQAQGETHGMKEDDIVTWVCAKIGAGNVSLVTKAWGLSPG